MEAIPRRATFAWFQLAMATPERKRSRVWPVVRESLGYRMTVIRLPNRPVVKGSLSLDLDLDLFEIPHGGRGVPLLPLGVATPPC